MGEPSWRASALGAAALVLVSFLTVDVPGGGGAQNTGTTLGNPAEGVPGQTASGPEATSRAADEVDAKVDEQVAAGGQLECKAGRNGESTDVGVTGNKIHLASTNVRSGVGSSFLGQSHTGMEAVVTKVNAAGGVCGRLLELRLVDDGWDANRGRQFIENFVKEGYFALPVVPSSEGLTAAIEAGVIGKAGIPVIGTDGMLKEQYQDPWVWPVATATVSTMRAMAKHAHDKGARTFGIVYDNQYRFGVEGARAFKKYVESLPGAKLSAYVGIPPLRPSYGGDVKTFNDACEQGGAVGCHFVAMLLEPSTAESWIGSQPGAADDKKGFGTKLTGGAQPLFNDRFARNCGAPCSGMLVWTGYNPPVGPLKDLPDVAEYVRDVRSLDAGADITNQFLEGAYLGMRVFVEALKRVGPNLKRSAVQEVMNSMTYENDIATSLRWTESNRFANQGAQAFEIVTAEGSFAGFRAAGTGFITDPRPGDVPS